MISEKVRTLLPRFREYIRERVIPLESRFLNANFAEVVAELDALRREVKSLKLWAPHLPETLGGLGLSLAEFAYVSEELGRTPIGHYVFNCQAPDAGNMELLLAHGSEEQKRLFLAPLASGAIRSCFSMTEPDSAGSNPLSLKTQAVRDGDSYVIDGRKWFTSGADGASFAIVMAVTNPDDPRPHKRASQIIVPTESPGFVPIRKISVMGQCGAGYASHSEVEYRACRVPITNRIGEEGSGFALAQERLGPGRIHHAMRWIGICERSFDLMCRRAVSRELSPGSTLSMQPVVQEWVAESRAEIDAARLMVLAAAEKLDAHGGRGAREEISTIKFFVANVMSRVVDRAIQVHGALGLTDDTPLAYWYSHERAARIYDGPDEVHKAVVARAIFKQYEQPVR